MNFYFNDSRVFRKAKTCFELDSRSLIEKERDIFIISNDMKDQR